MSIEENKKLAVGMLRHIESSTLSKENLTPDFHAWSNFSGDLETEAWLAAIAGKRNVQSGSSKFTIRGLTAEGDRVAVEASGHSPLPDGTAYTNVYHFLMTFRDGKTSSFHEYMDTRYLARKLGPMIPRIRDRAAKLGNSIEFPKWIRPGGYTPAEGNQKRAAEILDRIGTCTLTSEHLTPDFKAWSIFSGDIERDFWLTATAQKRKMQSGNTVFTVNAMTAEGDRVAVEATDRCPLPNEDPYGNVYHYLMIFRDGKLAAFKEYFDTRYFLAKLGPLIPRLRERAEKLGDTIVLPD